jgi:beta-lactam-binding protein with PASTA domain/tRNA A-37 threonylcarbamoyl transferase component Bud32
VATLRIADSLGRVLGGRYRLTRPLGTGASAHVYVADDITLRRRVAIKVLHPGLADDEAFLRRFRAEARVVAALRHPNILRVYDWGEDDGRPYLVTELLEGGSLRALLDRGYLLSPSQATAVGFGAAEALVHAHRRGLVHRDIKPANLLFDDEGRVCIADFGLARALAESTVTEPAGAIIGTARYAAPEQVRGQVLDARADVYALALVVVEATTGVVPFAADTILGTLMARLSEPLRLPGGGPLAAVIEAAGTIDPAGRLDAAGVVRALDALARTLPPPAMLPIAGPLDTGDIERDVDPTELRGMVAGSPPASHLPAADAVVFEGDGAPARPSGSGVSGRGGERPPTDRLDEGAAAEAATSTADGLSSAGGPSRSGRRWWRRLALVAVALLVVAGGATGWVLTHRPVPLVDVPSVHGETVAEATAALSHQHLGLTVDGRSYDATAPGGTIIEQRPSTGRLAEHRSVAVTVSLGPRPVAVPSRLAGLSRAAAIRAVRAAGLEPGPVSTTSSLTVPAGDVISFTPSSGTLLPGGSVSLVVSTGKPLVSVPQLSGTAADSYTAAAAALTAAHLVPSQHLVYSDAVPAGHVVVTDPAPKASVRYGSAVGVDVSRGPHLVTVPYLGGYTVAEADQTLGDDGFNVTGVTGNPGGQVSGTDPAAGQSILYGSSIQILTG